MLSNLFKRKPRLDAPTADERLAALAALGDDAQEVFERLFLGDADIGVRLAALGRLTLQEVLVGALEDGAVARQTLERLRQLDADALAHATHPAVLRAAVVWAETATAARSAAERIATVDERMAAVVAHPSAPVRLELAESVWEPSALTALERCAKGADNRLHRLAKERAAAYRKALADRADEERQTTETLAAAAALADDDPHYDARRAALEHKWRERLAAAQATDAALRPFGVAARDLAALRQRFPAPRAPRETPPMAGQAWEALAEDAERLLASVRAGVATPEDAPPAPTSETRTAIDALNARWDALAHQAPPEEAVRERFLAASAKLLEHQNGVERAAALAKEVAEALAAAVPAAAQFPDLSARKHEIDRLRAAVDRLIERHGWPPDAPPPAQLRALGERALALAEAASEAAGEVQTLADQLATGLGELRESIENGAARRAVEQEQRLRELARQLPEGKAEGKASTHLSELKQLGAEVRELRKWRLFAEAPKREALCEEMEALAAAPRPPDAQTEAVRDIRQRWKALGAIDAQLERQQGLRQRFEAAAESAFATCREHFKKQAERRAYNQEQRGAIVTALEQFLANNDWKHADWRGVEKVLRQARAEWRSYYPVERKSERALKTRFEELASRIHALLKAAWDANAQAKEAIVGEAEAVRASGQQASAKADAMKALQRRWKQVGPVPRAADQRLWKRFRAECDAVFEDRTAAMGRHTERRAAIDEAEALLDELERRVDFDASLDRNAVADYRQRVDALGSLPKALLRRAEMIIQDADRVVVEQQRGV